MQSETTGLEEKYLWLRNLGLVDWIIDLFIEKCDHLLFEE